MRIRWAWLATPVAALAIALPLALSQIDRSEAEVPGCRTECVGAGGDRAPAGHPGTNGQSPPDCVTNCVAGEGGRGGSGLPAGMSTEPAVAVAVASSSCTTGCTGRDGADGGPGEPGADGESVPDCVVRCRGGAGGDGGAGK